MFLAAPRGFFLFFSLQQTADALGPEHLDTLKNMDNLARLYAKNRLYTFAEALFNRALAIRGKKLGSEHPDVIRNINNLAGKFAKDPGDPDDSPCRFEIKRTALSTAQTRWLPD